MSYPKKLFSLILFSNDNAQFRNEIWNFLSGIPLKPNSNMHTYHIKNSLSSQHLNIYRNFTIFGHQKCIDVLTWLHKHINFNKLHVFFICHLPFFLGNQGRFFHTLYSTRLITKIIFKNPNHAVKNASILFYENITIHCKNMEGRKKRWGGGDGGEETIHPFATKTYGSTSLGEHGPPIYVKGMRVIKRRKGRSMSAPHFFDPN
jgi:hypothetical protein